MKYVHFFETAADFNAAYNNEEEGSYVKSIVTPLGTFAYSRGIAANFYWVNPATQKELWTWRRVPKIGVWDYASEGDWPESGDDFLGAGDVDKLNEWSWGDEGGNPPEGTFVEITALNWGDVHYSEPWVSYTPDSGIVAYNKSIWLDLSGYEYPVYGGSPVSFGVVPNPPVTGEGQVALVKEPDGNVYKYTCLPVPGGDELGFQRTITDTKWYTIRYSKSDSTAIWRVVWAG